MNEFNVGKTVYQFTFLGSVKFYCNINKIDTLKLYYKEGWVVYKGVINKCELSPQNTKIKSFLRDSDNKIFTVNSEFYDWGMPIHIENKLLKYSFGFREANRTKKVAEEKRQFLLNKIFPTDDREYIDNIMMDGGKEYRKIHKDYINRIMADELSDDLYMLGCFTPSFIASILNIDKSAIKDIQRADCMEALGKFMLPHIKQVVLEYVEADGYGHHFAMYDSEQVIDGDWYVFRIS